MVRAKKEVEAIDAKNDVDDFSDQLIKDLNKSMGMKVAWDLSKGDAPTVVKRWVDSGSTQLNYLIRNAAEGGYPEGRIVEVSGLPSTGKSTLALLAAANVQRQGGLVIYIDSENAIMVDRIHQLGVDVNKRFVYVESSVTEDVFAIIEQTILKAKQVVKDVPILIVWDSLASCSPKAEAESSFDQNSMGLQARTLSKGFRKITQTIGQNAVTLMCLNQLREAIGVMHGDPYVSPGGKSLPFHASVRIRLGSGRKVEDKNKNVVGSHVTVTTIKNKVGINFRKCELDIMFGRGIQEDEYIFDEVRSFCAEHGPIIRDGKSMLISGVSAWKELLVTDTVTNEVIVNKKFHKSDFGSVRNVPEYKQYVDQIIDTAYTKTFNDDVLSSEIEDDDTSDEE